MSLPPSREVTATNAKTKTLDPRSGRGSPTESGIQKAGSLSLQTQEGLAPRMTSVVPSFCHPRHLQYEDPGLDSPSPRPLPPGARVWKGFSGLPNRCIFLTAFGEGRKIVCVGGFLRIDYLSHNFFPVLAHACFRAAQSERTHAHRAERALFLLSHRPLPG